MKNIRKYIHSSLKENKKPKSLFLLSLLVLAVLSLLYMRYTWITSMNETSEKTLKIARTAEVALNGQMIKMLSAVQDDEGTIAYESIKERLMNLIKLQEDFRFAYIYTQRDGKLYFIADSEPADSKDYSPPGQELKEATSEDKKPFKDGKPIITQPLTDRWGTWVSILVPMEDNETGKIIAVFGMDYPAKAWNSNAFCHTIQAGVIVFALFLLLFAFHIIFNKNYMLKNANKEIKMSEEKFSKAFHSNAALMAISTVEDGSYIDVNETFLETLGFKRDEVIGKKIIDLNIFIDNEQREKLKSEFEKEVKIRNIEVKAKGKNSFIHIFLFSMDRIVIGVKPCWITMMIDITERKRAEEEILYLSYHDQLTGLYNRRFYEEELRRLDTPRNLPMTIAIGDVNGLKLINDSFGHAAGDELLKKVAEVIKKSCRADDIIARLGGDEFIILLPKTDAVETEQIIKRIKKLALNEKVESIDISISFGYETKHNESEEIQKILKKAEDYMYKKKLFENQSLRGKAINAIINTLHENNKREELHSNRVASLCERMGIALKLPEDEIMELKTVGLFHDIGKIAIDENILNNTGKLTDDEWKQIKRHPEIGYRILSTANDMSDMAEYVLAHHERWDGKGYPKGLTKEEIPFVSRIIAIADSYDAMTSDRSYQSILPEEAAIEVLQKNAGVKFDPQLVNIFIEKVLGKSV